jgi:purine nucleosidase
MRTVTFILILCVPAIIFSGCTASSGINKIKQEKIRIILDSDTNNEIDDQYAIAYMLFNGQVFDVEGITTNATRDGGNIEEHTKEARRVVTLCSLQNQIKVYSGANGSFDAIKDHVDQSDFDGSEAVNFIISQAHAKSSQKLLLLPIGKLTNIALALKKDPSIASKVRIVWLGSNYPESGEYNEKDDLASVSYVLETEADFEIALARYHRLSGTDAVRVTPAEIKNIMPGKGPHIAKPIAGRHGQMFDNFGDYAVSLIENIWLDGTPPSRALYDMAGVAIIKNPAWARPTRIQCPKLEEGNWVDQPNNPRKIIIWEYFDKENILKDFFNSMENYIFPEPK